MSSKRIKEYNGLPVKNTLKEVQGTRANSTSIIEIYNGSGGVNDDMKLYKCPGGYVILCSHNGCNNISKPNGINCIKHTVSKLDKADLISIAKTRKYLYTNGKLHSMNVEILTKLIGDITPNEINEIAIRKERRKQYAGDIDYNTGIYGVPVSYSKNMKLDCLLGLPVQRRITLNTEQMSIFQHINKEEILLVAGPGAGKTSTLVEMVKYLGDHKFNVLVLMYGVNVEKQFQRKLKALSVSLQSKQKIKTPEGIYVVTFHKYAYHSRWSAFANSDLTQFRTHDDLVERTITISPSHTEKWDYLIIDEAQDLKNMYYKLVKSINAKHIIYMGDGRQQVNSGADIYSNLLLKANPKDIHKLICNHRSTKEIVNVLNTFSRTNFPVPIDIQQTSMTSIPQSVVIVRDNEANLVAKYISECQPGSTFAISPVSVNKYGADTTVNEIRQLLYTENNRKISIMESGRELDPTKDYITNSINIKGLERDFVILFGISNTQLYIDYTIPEYTLKCLIYVAMSRAKKRLIIVIDDSTYVSPNLLDSCLLGHISLESNPYNHEKVHFNTKHTYIPSISVTDLAEYDFNPIVTCINTLPKIHFDRDDIEDCSGYFVEAKIASSLGILNDKYLYCRTNVASEESSWVEDSTYKCRVLCNDQTQNKIISIFKDINESSDSIEYKYVRAMYVCRIKDDWTVSERLRNTTIDVEPYIHAIKPLIDDKDSVVNPSTTITSIIMHSEKVRYDVLVDRSNKIGSHIMGVLDISSNRGIIEIKHAHDNRKHHNQALIYGVICKEPTYICNTLEGTISSVESRNTDFNRYVRSVMILREAHISRTKYTLDLPKGIILCIDTEFQDKNVYEIGAVVMDTVNMKILGTYQKIAGCKALMPGFTTMASSDEPGDFFAELTGLKITGTPILDVDYADFYQWIKQWPNPILVQWGGCDVGLLQLTHRNTLDLSEFYRIYMSHTAIQFSPIKSGYRLCDAVETIFPPNIPWQPHRAFEDAVMTMGVYYALMTPR